MPKPGSRGAGPPEMYSHSNNDINSNSNHSNTSNDSRNNSGNNSSNNKMSKNNRVKGLGYRAIILIVAIVIVIVVLVTNDAWATQDSTRTASV